LTEKLLLAAPPRRLDQVDAPEHIRLVTRLWTSPLRFPAIRSTSPVDLRGAGRFSSNGDLDLMDGHGQGHAELCATSNTHEWRPGCSRSLFLGLALADAPGIDGQSATTFRSSSRSTVTTNFIVDV